MLKRNLVRIFVVSVILCMTYTDIFADIRVRFARGRTSATLSGPISGGGSVCFVAGARGGQTLNAAVSSTNGRARFMDSGETSYSLYIDRTGDNSFCINNNGRSTRYTLTVSIQ